MNSAKEIENQIIRKSVKNVVMLVNLGSPDRPSKHAVYDFLSRFLWDKRVVKIPKILWWPILHYGVIPIKMNVLAMRYERIWMDKYSPLMHYTVKQYEKIKNIVDDEDTIIVPAFSYSTPSVKDQLEELHKFCDVTNLKIVPLYPQFSSTTTSAVFDQVAKYYSNKVYLPNTLQFMRGFHDNPRYIKAICDNINKSWVDNGKGQILVFSYHSLPQKLIDNGDKYFDECIATTKLIVDNLGLENSEYKISFQSKFGAQKWITPKTDQVIKDLAIDGTTNIDVICPGFFNDCLETLEEIDIINRELFIKNGGVKFTYIPCLNDSDGSIELLLDLIKN